MHISKLSPAVIDISMDLTRVKVVHTSESLLSSSIVGMVAK